MLGEKLAGRADPKFKNSRSSSIDTSGVVIVWAHVYRDQNSGDLADKVDSLFSCIWMVLKRVNALVQNNNRNVINAVIDDSQEQQQLHIPPTCQS
jgi:hypothetical protein